MAIYTGEIDLAEVGAKFTTGGVSGGGVGDDTIAFLSVFLLEGSSWSTGVLTVRRRLWNADPFTTIPTSVLTQSPQTISASAMYGYYDIMGTDEFGVQVTTAAAARLLARVTIKTQGAVRVIL